MNRSKRRRLKEVKIKYSEEIETLIEFERNSMKRINQIDLDHAMKVLRNNRVGKSRAEKIIKEMFEGE